MLVFLVRIPKIYIYAYGVRIRTNQECFGDPLNRACFHTSKTVLSHIFKKKIKSGDLFPVKKPHGAVGPAGTRPISRVRIRTQMQILLSACQILKF
jgi:hypothetical protein